MISKEIFDESKVPQLVIGDENLLENIQKLIDLIKESNEFKRLADRTQIIFNDNNKYANMVQNRQSHTLIVAEISYKIAKKFGFSELECKLAELIGLCHDLGHVAFGHTGENRIDVALKYFGITSQEFNDAYFKTNKIDIGLSKRFGEMSHAFEHHAQSTRVLRKILKDKNVVIKNQDILDTLELGILAHSQSRAEKMKIPYRVSAITRYADKFYIFTDALDVVKATEDGILLDAIKETLENSKSLDNTFGDKAEAIRFVVEVFGNFVKFQDNALEEYKEEYINNSELIFTENGWRVVANLETDKYLKVLKTLVRTMRVDDTIGKEEELVNAMIDEVILYRVENAEKDENGNFKKTEKERVIDACLAVGEMEDTKLRKEYEKICDNQEWVKNYPDLIRKIRGLKEVKEEDIFPIELADEKRDILRERTDIVLNHYFKLEINKIQDMEAKKKLFQLLANYKKTMSRKDKKELIDLIEQLNGGKSSVKKSDDEGPGGEDR